MTVSKPETTKLPLSAPAVTAELELVTPDLAEQWIGKNGSNRNLRNRVVDSYARDMVAGNWRIDGSAIRFAHNGRLLDGQHRLHAVKQAGVSVQMLIVRGLEEESQLVMDSGAARTAGDALRLQGEGNYSSLAAAARLAITYETTGLVTTTRAKTTHTEIIDWLALNSDMRRAVELAHTWSKQIDVPMSVLSLAVWRLNRVDADQAMLFFSRLAEKTNLTARDPILALINRLIEIRRNNRLVDRADYLSLLFRAWNYWRTRKQVAALPIQTSGMAVDIPEPK